MILQELLEDKRFEWQKATQEQILNNLLCKSHRYKAIGQRDEKLVMVFGKSHSGKTTLILSLMGVDEEKLAELNCILRAGIPEGKSSTSTAIIYQKSDDDYFGVCERSINDMFDYQIIKCSKDEFIDKIKKTRLAVENRERSDELILYLYIPCYYFGDNDFASQHINILDVPGHETTNLEEQYHTQTILNKYMSVSVLNIVVRSIYDINDLRYFCAPNRDDFTKLLSSKYIVVTTRSYSQESIFKYFLKTQEERKKNFEEILNEECRIQLERIFGTQIPLYFPVDIGESFNELINTKITDQYDREYIIEYRKRVFGDIYKCIKEKKSNSLISWIKEVMEDEDYYGNIESSIIDTEINKLSEILENNRWQKKKNNDTIIKLEKNLTEVGNLIDELSDAKKSIQIPDSNELIESKVNVYINEYLTPDCKWKTDIVVKDLSEIFARLYSEIVTQIFNDVSEKYNVVDEDMYKKWLKNSDDKEVEIRDELNKQMNEHIILKVLNPSNKEKVELGRNKIYEEISKVIHICYSDILKQYEKVIAYKKSKEYNTFRILIEEYKQKNVELISLIKEQSQEMILLEKKKKAVVMRMRKDKELIGTYRKIAYEKFSSQKKEIIELMNDAKEKEEKIEYLLLLGLIEMDYRKVVME